MVQLYSHFKLQQTIPSLLRISTEQENNKLKCLPAEDGMLID